MRVYSEKYETWGDFAAHVDAPKTTGCTWNASRDGDQQFTGTQDWADAVRVALDGDTARETQVAQILAQVSQTLQVRGAVEQVRELSYAYEGEYIDVSRYTEGEPECWGQWGTVDTDNPKRSHVRIVCDISYAGDISANDITANGAAIAALVDTLEAQGRQCDVWAVLAVSGYGTPDLDRVVFAVCVKRAEDAVDRARLVYALCHPSMLRRHLLSAIERTPEHVQKYIGKGYGSPRADSRNAYEAAFPDWADTDTVYCNPDTDFAKRATVSGAVAWIEQIAGGANHE